MKKPIFETSPGATLALLFSTGPSGRAFAYFDLYTITCAQGPVLRYTTCDIDISYGGTTWSSNTVRIEPASQRNALFHAKVGLDVDTWQAVFYPRPVDDLTGAAYPDTIGSTSWLAAAAAGALDGATVTVDRAYFPVPVNQPYPAVYEMDGYGNTVVDGYGSPIMVSPPQGIALTLTPTGVLRIFAGRVAEVDMGRTGACVSVNSHLELLNVQMPRNLFQAPCRHRLFDAGCTLSAPSYAVSGTVGAGSTRSVLLSGAAAPGGSGNYTLGRVVFSSGVNSGFSRSVRSWVPGTFALISPLPFMPASGDTFSAYPGCDKTLGTCGAFGNTANFGGHPFIPAPETAS